MYSLLCPTVNIYSSGGRIIYNLFSLKVGDTDATIKTQAKNVVSWLSVLDIPTWYPSITFLEISPCSADKPAYLSGNLDNPETTSPKHHLVRIHSRLHTSALLLVANSTCASHLIGSRLISPRWVKFKIVLSLKCSFNDHVCNCNAHVSDTDIW